MRERRTYQPLLHSGQLPDLDTYVSIRSQTIGVRPTVVHIEFAHGFELRDDLLRFTPVDALHEIASRLVFLANDIFGLEKDLESNWPNTVTVLSRQYDLSLLDALELAVRIHNEHVVAFIDIERSVPRFDSDLDSPLQQYLRDLHFVIRGFAEWEMRAERYQWKKQLAESSFRHRVTISSFSDE